MGDIGFPVPRRHQSGPTSKRPHKRYVGQAYFDTDLDAAVWWNGERWVEGDMPLTYDFVIVGLGTAGALAASLLSAAGYSVLATEAGSDTRTDPTVLSPVYGQTDTRADLNHAYEAVVAPFAAIVPLVLFRMGRGWSGCSAHSYMLNGWPTAGVMADWASVHPRWSFENRLPSRKWCETFIPLPGRTPNVLERGFSGGMAVNQYLAGPPIPADNDFVVAVAGAFGMTKVEDYNDSAQRFGIGECQLYVTLTDPPVRSSSATAFLPNVVRDAAGDGSGPNLTIRSEARAISLLWDESLPRVTGVRYVQAGRTRDVLAARKVVLCAGGVETPALLQRSGYGPRALLEGLGIPVRVANDHVGHNMQNHPLFLVGVDNSPSGQDAIPLCNGYAQLGSSGVRDVQLITLANGAGSIVVCDMRPSASGKVEIQSKDPFLPPRLDFGYAASQATWMPRMVAALKLLANATIAYSGRLPSSPPPAAFPAAEYGSVEQVPTGARGEAADDSALEAFIVANGQPANHPSGTCRMATSAAGGVVDGDLNVFGVEGLAIADNSVVPQIGDVNTTSTALLMALGLVEVLLGEANVPWAA